MTTNQTDFTKKHEFGEFISIPLTFFFQEFVMIIKGLLIFVLPFLLIEIFLTQVLHIANKQALATILTEGWESNLNNYSNYGFLFALLNLFKNAMLYSFLGVYIKLYITTGKGNFGINEIWNEIKRYYLNVVLGNFISIIVIIVGLILILLPGIYLSVVLSLIVPVIIFEDLPAGKAFTRTFEVMKGNWWMSFGAFVVFIILIIILSLIVGLLIGSIFGFMGGGSMIVSFSSLISGLIDIFVASILAILPILLYTDFSEFNSGSNLSERVTQLGINDENAGSEGIFTEVQSEKQQSDENNTEEPNDDRFKPKY